MDTNYNNSETSSKKQMLINKILAFATIGVIGALIISVVLTIKKDLKTKAVRN